MTEPRQAFEYAVLRAVPRVDRGEFVNVGVVLYAQATDFLEARTHIDPVRLRALDEPTVLRQADYKVTAVIVDEALIDVEPGDTTDRRFAIAFDLGISSTQLDDPGRGLSFRFDGPLDMRMDPDEPVPTAADIVNGWNREDLSTLIRSYGEERFAGSIASAIIRRRATEPIVRTVQLRDIVLRGRDQDLAAGLEEAGGALHRSSPRCVGLTA